MFRLANTPTYSVSVTGDPCSSAWRTRTLTCFSVFFSPSTAGPLKPSRGTFPCAAVREAPVSSGSVSALTQHLGGKGVDTKRKAQQLKNLALGNISEEQSEEQKISQANDHNQGAKTIQQRGIFKLYSSIADTICYWNHTSAPRDGLLGHAVPC